MTRSEYQTLIETLADNQPNAAATVRAILGALADGATFTGEMKMIEVATSYIASNFDGTGLGTNEMLGYAICNGQNGTRDWRGRTPLAYDSADYPTLGAIGGAKNVSLTKDNIPILDATFPVSNNDNAGGTKVYIMATDVDPQGTHLYANTINTATTNTPVDVRQSFRVTLFIMKL
jgi:microcystin-dependent protein